MNKCLMVILCAFALLTPARLWAADPDLTDYKLVKTLDFSTATYATDTYITLGAETGITAYETGNARQQKLCEVATPVELKDYLQFQAVATESSLKGWWIRSSRGGLYSPSASRSAAVVNLKEGYVVKFTAVSGSEISAAITLTDADDKPDGNFTYEKSSDGESYWCTMTKDGYVGFCGEKNGAYLASITIYAPPTALITPTASITGVDGTGRKVTFEGVNLGYNTDGSDNYTITDQTSLELSVSETTTFYVVSTDGDNYSDVLEYTVEAGTEVQLNAPVVSYKRIGNGFNKEFTVTCDNSDVFLNPTAVLTYDFVGTDGTIKKDVPFVDYIQAFEAGTYTVKASYSGYKSSQVVIDNSISYVQTLAIDFTKDELVDELSNNWKLQNEGIQVPGSDSSPQWRTNYGNVVTDEYYYDFTSGTASAEDVIDGLTIEIADAAATQGITPKFYSGFGLMYPVYKLRPDGSNGNSANKSGQIGIADGAADQLAVYTYLNNYGNGGVKSAVQTADQTFSLYRYSDLLTMVEVYTPTSSTALTMTVPALGCTTFVPASNVIVPDDVEVYTVTMTNGVVALHEVEAGSLLPANTGVLVKATPGDYTFDISSMVASDLANNDLKASVEDFTADGTQYVLGDGAQGVGFYAATSGSTIQAREAYLVYDGTASVLTLPNEIGTKPSESTTAIDGVESDATDDDAYYTLEGIRVQTPSKGIYIHKGKKVVIK